MVDALMILSVMEAEFAKVDFVQEIATILIYYVNGMKL